MSRCEELLEHLDDAVEGRLPEALAEHLATCAECQGILARVRDAAEGARAMRGLRAPDELIRRLALLPRLAPACEHAQELLRSALDDELGEDDRSELLDHLHGCSACQAVWESFATLREVGALTRPSRRLTAALAIHPSQHIQARRQPRRLLNLRLATAAAYLVAAASIVFVGNPATIARASSTAVDRAGLYARAVVENRVEAYSRKAKETWAVGQDWVTEQAVAAWDRARSLLAKDKPNPKVGDDVSPGGNGGNR